MPPRSSTSAFKGPGKGRIMKEIDACRTDKEAKIKVELVDDNLSHLKGTFEGPPATPYEGGHFVVDIQIPADYPFKPPKMKFDTRIYHPNISSQTGAICLDILKDGVAWSPVYTLKTALISLQSLLQSPEPNDPQDAEVAKHFIRDRKGFEETARAWTALHAKDNPDALPAGMDISVVKSLEEMGFSRADVVKALSKAGNNADRAAEILLTGA
ncbi:hypothetical protein M427DRAFT_51418 [Gonapodya prolifera JEL478]|uniref:Ubiquitin-conjugating enzyme E2 1 n=1 Tax=Gonapodya prolifera (strain JEL478) TaxID=1344416 RepID=A0A139AWQ2_GONPJ|nr:hypothetical protein M427DRAFT_51418 [Gonapodya prolifera JEL478]|eukprot:KXS21150.1 hypothetical protein M427DRAFT_51418 [Gonapodya prolifera JEL478]